MLQDLCNTLLQPYNGESGGPAPSLGGNMFADTTATPLDKQHDVWGSNVFSLPELGGDLLGDTDMTGLHNNTMLAEPAALNAPNALRESTGSLPPAPPASACAAVGVLSVDETSAMPITDSRAAMMPVSGQRVAYVSSSAPSTFATINGCTATPTMGNSLVYTPQTNQLSLSSLVSVGGAASAAGSMPSPGASNSHGTATTGVTNMNGNASGMLPAGAYAQTAAMAPAMPGNFPAFFATAQGAGNVMMFAPTPPAQTLCFPAGAQTMIPYFVIPSPQQAGLELSGAMAYSPMTAAGAGGQPIGPVMCAPWQAAAAASPVGVNGSAVGGTPSHPGLAPPPNASPNAAMAGMPPPPQPMASVSTAPPPIAGYGPLDTNPSSPSNGGAGAMHNGEKCATPRGTKGSPPSYDSLRLQLTKRRQPPGRQRSGTNVHGSLQGICAYYSYNLSAALKQYEQPDARPARPGEQVLPVFIQMFPCELRERTIVVLNRVVEATCGPDIATVVGIEPRSETSFIALVRTNAVWLLIHKLRCRVLMDRHGFWYAEDMEQYLRLKEYCEGVRRLPQQMRHFQTDGLPCMPLVVELSRSVNASAVTSPAAPPSFDEVAPIATVERHGRSGTGNDSNDDECSPNGDSSSAGSN